MRFRSFRELVDLADHFGRDILQVPKFTDDPYFVETAEEAAEENEEHCPPQEVATNETLTEHVVPRSRMRQMIEAYHRQQAERKQLEEITAEKTAVKIRWLFRP